MLAPQFFIEELRQFESIDHAVFYNANQIEWSSFSISKRNTWTIYDMVAQVWATDGFWGDFHSSRQTSGIPSTTISCFSRISDGLAEADWEWTLG